MPRPILSFAIPIYNFERFIGSTIESIMDGAQLLQSHEFEVFVLDGGSSDATAEVLETLMGRYPNLRYQRMPQRGGIDHDLNLAVNSVDGHYVWLFSGDDLLVPGWDRYIQPLLATSDVVLVPSLLCNLDMSERRRKPIFTLPKGVGVSTFSVADGEASLASYLQKSRSLDTLFGFMSSVIVRSDFWHSLPEREDYYGTCWAHCARLIQGFKKGCLISYLPEYLIRKRGDNDSFMEKGFVARIGISVEGWKRIIEEFFQNSSIQSLAYSLLRKDISIALFLYGKVSAKSSVEAETLRAMAHMLYCEKSPSILSRLQYWVFFFSPFNACAAPVIDRGLPYLIRLRHRVKKACM